MIDPAGFHICKLHIIFANMLTGNGEFGKLEEKNIEDRKLSHCIL